MKKITLIICLAIAAKYIYAENVKGVLKRATVYFSGAELTHTVNVSLRQGENSLTIEGLTPNIDVNSLKINGGHRGQRPAANRRGFSSES